MAARDLHAAPPNTSQIEAYEGDLEAATKDQINPKTDEINEAVAKANKEAVEEHKKLRDERVENGAVPDTRKEFASKTEAELKDEDKKDAPKTPAKTDDKK